MLSKHLSNGISVSHLGILQSVLVVHELMASFSTDGVFESGSGQGIGDGNLAWDVWRTPVVFVNLTGLGS